MASESFLLRIEVMQLSENHLIVGLVDQDQKLLNRVAQNDNRQHYGQKSATETAYLAPTASIYSLREALTELVHTQQQSLARVYCTSAFALVFKQIVVSRRLSLHLLFILNRFITYFHLSN